MILKSANFRSLFHFLQLDSWMNKKRAEIKIYGEVQGVSFRARICEIAKNLGLAGYVKNEPDGSVVIIAEGREEELKTLLEKCYNIPNSRVVKIDVEWGEAENEFGEFSIKYNV